MEPTSTTPTPSPAPTGTPALPAEQPQTQSTPSAPQKSKLLLVILLVIVLLVAGGSIFYYLSVKNSGTKTSNNATGTNSTATTSITEEESAATTTSSFTNPDSKTTISVTHPKSWQIITEPDKSGLKQITIKSAKGNYLHMFPNMGVGGYCEPDNDSYTLVKRIPTQNPMYVFSEYTTSVSRYPVVKLSLEPLERASAAHRALKEGESATDICTNIGGYYPIIGDIFVKIDTSATVDSSTAVAYNELKADTDFIAMLQSLSVKTGE